MERIDCTTEDENVFNYTSSPRGYNDVVNDSDGDHIGISNLEMFKELVRGLEDKIELLTENMKFLHNEIDHKNGTIIVYLYTCIHH